MDKLEQYVEQVCNSIGGPVELRQHVRQELREHLLDAVAQHKAAGLSEADAVAKALEEFGKPEEVRSELESAYGQRMVWIVDKAMQWKERTMKAKWLWTAWAYLALAMVIALEILFITFMVIFIVPKFQTLLRLGLIDSEMLEEQAASAWMPGFLDCLKEVGGGYATWWLLLAVVLIGLFEWRVKSENKSFMRLSVLGTVAVGLMVVVTLTAGALIIPPCLAMPAMTTLGRPYALEQVATIDGSIKEMQAGLAKEEWDVVGKHGKLAHDALRRLERSVVTGALANGSNPPMKVEELRSHVETAQEGLPRLALK